MPQREKLNQEPGVTAAKMLTCCPDVQQTLATLEEPERGWTGGSHPQTGAPPPSRSVPWTPILVLLTCMSPRSANGPGPSTASAIGSWEHALTSTVTRACFLEPQRPHPTVGLKQA